MVIPSGDLAPLRRHRRYGRHRSRWPVAVAVLAVGAVAAVTYAVQYRAEPEQVSAAASCVSPAASPAASASTAAKGTTVRLPAPGQVSLRLLNGTGRDRLARTVADELARRGFQVSHTGNAPRGLVGASRVYYGPGGRPAALLVTAHVLGASVVPVSTAARGAVDVVLGSTFVRLRTPAETSAYARQLISTGVPASKPPAKPERSPSCR